MNYTPYKKRHRSLSKRNITFSTNIEHHIIYDFITEDLVKFYNYFIGYLNDLNITYIDKFGKEQKEYWYVNIIQKSQNYDGISKYNDDTRGDLIIEFINNNKINDYRYRSSFFYDKCRLLDAHITLHKYSKIPRKFHFSYTDKNKISRKKQLNLKVNGSNIMFKNSQQNKILQFSKEQEDDIKIISTEIINIINDYIKIKLLKKLENERKQQNKIMLNSIGTHLYNHFPNNNYKINEINNEINNHVNKKFKKSLNFKEHKINKNILEEGEINKNNIKYNKTSKNTKNTKNTLEEGEINKNNIKYNKTSKNTKNTLEEGEINKNNIKYNKTSKNTKNTLEEGEINKNTLKKGGVNKNNIKYNKTSKNTKYNSKISKK